MGIWTTFFKFQNKNTQKQKWQDLTPMRVLKNGSIIDVKYC